MKLVSCGADGTLWAVNDERFTFRMDKERLRWEQMPGSFKQVCNMLSRSATTKNGCARPSLTIPTMTLVCRCQWATISTSGVLIARTASTSGRRARGRYTPSRTAVPCRRPSPSCNGGLRWRVQRVTMSQVPQHISVASDGSIVAMDKDTNGDINMKQIDYTLNETKEAEVN